MNTLWYKKAASVREEALPVGNGRLGALVYGKPHHEIIELSEESVWSSPHYKRENPLAVKSLKEVRSLIKKNRIPEAQELMLETFSGTPENQAHYVSAGSIHIDFYNSESYGVNGPGTERNSVFSNATTYRRELDLETGIVTTSFSKDMDVQNTAYLSKNAFGSSITYTREAFVSSSSNVLVYHVAASTPKSIYFRVNLEHPHCAKKFSLAEDTIGMTVTQGIPFAVLASVSVSGGKVFIRGNYLIVEGADEANIYADVQSSFRKSDYFKNGGDVLHRLSSLASWCADRALKNVCFALGTDYQSLKKNHMDEYASSVAGAKLAIGEIEETSLPSVDELISSAKTNSASFEKLSELFWNYSRYLLVSSVSKPGTLPSLKNGIWYDGSDSQRYDFYPSSVDSFYSLLPGTRASLPDADKPLFDFLKLVCKNGKHTAHKMLDMDGSLVFSSTDLWGDTAPSGTDFSKSYWPLGSVAVALLVRDRFEYTQDKKFLKKYFPVMKKACEFASQYLSLSADGSRLLLTPMVSDGYTLSDGTEAFVRAGTEEDSLLVKELFKSTIECAAYLGMPFSGDELMKYQASMEKLSCPEKEISLEPFDSEKLLSLSENLMGENFSLMGSITESIVKNSVTGSRVKVEILSDAPKIWKKGSLEGISLRGNLYADVSWNDGRINEARVYAKQGTVFLRDLTIVYMGKSYETRLAENSLDLLNVLPSTV